MTETGLTTVQVARRTGDNVVINRPLWDKMSEEQQAAFVVHEVVYFAVDPRSIQFNACKVNDFVAMIYTEEGLEKATLQRPTWLAMFGIFQAH